MTCYPLQNLNETTNISIFALLSFIPSQWLGRKMTILSASVVFTVGSVVMGIANNKEILLIGRLIVGIAIGNKITIIYVKMWRC